MSETTTTEKTAPVEGTWQHTLNKSAALAARSDKARKQASNLLWKGAVTGIESWLESGDDEQAEGFYNEVLDMLGTSRKGDASKIKTVALAVSENGLVLADQANLSKAYAEATRLRKTVKEEEDQDTAADEVVEVIAENAPKTASTADAAAQILLAKGLDEAARALLDALNGPSGEDNPQAHKALLRTIANEIAGRVPKPEPKPAKEAKPKPAKKAAAKKAPAKAKTKAKPAEKGTAEANAVSTPDVPVKPKAKPSVVRRPS